MHPDLDQASTQAMAFQAMDSHPPYLAHQHFPIHGAISLQVYNAFLHISPILAGLYDYPFIHLRVNVTKQLLYQNKHPTLTL